MFSAACGPVGILQAVDGGQILALSSCLPFLQFSNKKVVLFGVCRAGGRGCWGLERGGMCYCSGLMTQKARYALDPTEIKIERIDAKIGVSMVPKFLLALLAGSQQGMRE